MIGREKRTQASDQAARAQPPRAPALGPAALKAKAESRAYLEQRERLELRSVLRGLVLLAILALLITLFRADLGRAFFSGWWRQW